MLLFEAPLDFDPAVFAEYRAWMPETHDPQQVTVWVCDPLGGEIAELHLLQFKNLKVLATPSTGTDHIDAFACKRLGVKVLSLLDDRQGLETISASAEFTFKLLLDALRLLPGRELQGKKVGIVGRGRIGRRLLHWLSAFEASGFFRDPAVTASPVAVLNPPAPPPPPWTPPPAPPATTRYSTSGGGLAPATAID